MTEQTRNTAVGFAFSLLVQKFEYLECLVCHRFEAVGRMTQPEAKRWKFDLIGLRPSPLGVAKARCPACVQAEQEFQGPLKKVGA